MGAVDKLIAGGFSQEEADKWAQDKSATLLAAGFSNADVSTYIGAKPARAPDAPFAPAAAGVQSALRQHFEQVRGAKTFGDYIDAGFQQSVVGLAKRGKMPDVQVDPETPWYGRFLSGMAGLVGDAPAMVPGFVGGAAAGGAVGSAVPVVGTVAGGVVGGFAGAGALPAGLRSAMMEAYSKGEVKSASDFVDRALHVAWETTKGGLVGAATGGAGVAAKVALPAALGAVGTAAGVTAAEVTTMATVAKALEGQLPEPHDFLDAALVIGGVKGSIAVAGKLRTIYQKTGVPPSQVVVDAARDPVLKEELASTGPVEAKPGLTPLEKTVAQVRAETEGIPAAYQPLAAAETARSIVPGMKAERVAASPFAEELPQAPGEPAKPTHVNYDLINSAEDTKLAMARLSEVYESEIQAQRRGAVGWEETSNEAAKILSDTLGGIDTRLLMPREPGTPAGAAEILARKQITIGAAEAMMGARDTLLAKGSEASAEDRLAFLQSVERASMVQAEFLGARAEAGRALNILKSTAMDADRVKQIQQVIDMYGGRDPVLLAEMMKSIDTAAGAMKFAAEAVKATTWEKLIEAWKAGILSGPVTHIANLMGNGGFAALRIPIETVAAGLGKLHGGERVAPMEPLARTFGLLQGVSDGLRLAGAVLKNGEEPGKAEQFRKAISGVKGEVVRIPFRFLSAEDAVFRTMNERGALYSAAVRQASAENFNPLTREFRERVAQLVQTPTKEMTAIAEKEGARLTFNTELGEKGKAVQEFVRKWHLEWAVPFIRTPGNIFKELARMTPFAPLVAEWRAAMKAGGAERDKAIAEVTVGTGIMSVVFMHALNGNITGAGEPDPGKRRVQQAAGIQPYSIKVGDTYYNYQRLQPLGTLIGLAADVAEVWDHMTEEESDKVPKMLAAAFSNAVTNQTFLQGITNIVNAMSDPTRFFPRFAQQFAASAVPNIVAQPTAMLDPVAREINSITDAVKARIPGARGSLAPKLDIFGEPIQAKERLGAVSPITETTESTDKVRAEAARLGVSAADAPKKLHIGRGSGKIGDVELEPGERQRFAEVGGKLAHEVLSEIVNAPDWDALPDRMKKRAYSRVFTRAHRVAAAQALTPEKRDALVQQITEKVEQELEPETQ